MQWARCGLLLPVSQAAWSLCWADAALCRELRTPVGRVGFNSNNHASQTTTLVQHTITLKHINQSVQVFGRDVAETACSQEVIYFPPHLTNVSALPCLMTIKRFKPMTTRQKFAELRLLTVRNFSSAN